jgi:hypothetical protein
VYQEPPEHGYNLMAKWLGRHFRVAEEEYYSNHKTYTSSIEDLLAIDMNLTEKPRATFVFLHASDSGFTLYTKYGRTDNPNVEEKYLKEWIYTD